MDLSREARLSHETSAYAIETIARVGSPVPIVYPDAVQA